MEAIAENVCDQKDDCLDHSDELGESCKKIWLGKNYNKNYPPMPKFQNSSTDHYLSINTSIKILDIISVSQDPGKINFFIKLKFKWFDGNLKFSFLKDDDRRNPINATTEKTIWTPEIGFQYLHDDEKITFRSLLMQKLNTQEISENIDQLYSFRFYDGRQNSLKLEIFYKMSFLCHFKILSYEYPFGQDDCSLDIYFKDNNNLLVAFHVYELG